MAKTYKAKVYLTTSSSTKTYTFAFDYINKRYIKGRLNDRELVWGTDYTVLGHSFNLVQPPPSNGTLEIYRQTPSGKAVEWYDGSILRAKDLNLHNIQMLHITEENYDYFQDHFMAKDDHDNKWEARELIIKNVKDPVNAGDALNKKYFEAVSTGYLQRMQAGVDESKRQAGESTKQAGISTTQANRSQSEADRAKREADRAKAEADRAKREADKGVERVILTVRQGTDTINSTVRDATASINTTTRSAITTINDEKSDTLKIIREETTKATNEANRSKREADRAKQEADRAKQEADRAQVSSTTAAATLVECKGALTATQAQAKKATQAADKATSEATKAQHSSEQAERTFTSVQTATAASVQTINTTMRQQLQQGLGVLNDTAASLQTEYTSDINAKVEDAKTAITTHANTTTENVMQTIPQQVSDLVQGQTSVINKMAEEAVASEVSGTRIYIEDKISEWNEERAESVSKIRKAADRLAQQTNEEIAKLSYITKVDAKFYTTQAHHVRIMTRKSNNGLYEEWVSVTQLTEGSTFSHTYLERFIEKPMLFLVNLKGNEGTFDFLGADDAEIEETPTGITIRKTTKYPRLRGFNLYIVGRIAKGVFGGEIPEQPEGKPGFRPTGSRPFLPALPVDPHLPNHDTEEPPNVDKTPTPTEYVPFVRRSVDMEEPEIWHTFIDGRIPKPLSDKEITYVDGQDGRLFIRYVDTREGEVNEYRMGVADLERTNKIPVGSITMTTKEYIQAHPSCLTPLDNVEIGKLLAFYHFTSEEQEEVYAALSNWYPAGSAAGGGAGGTITH